MKRTLLSLTIFTSISANSQTWDRITPVQANLYEPTGDIEWYEPGAPQIPAPIEAAQLWQTSTGTVNLYGGRGYDQNLG